MTDPALAAELKKKRTFRTFSYRGVELDKLLDLGNEEVSLFPSTPPPLAHQPYSSSSRYVPVQIEAPAILTLCSSSTHARADGSSAA